MSEWESATVGDFFELVTGYAFKSKDFQDVGVPVIKIKNVKAGEFSQHEFSSRLCTNLVKSVRVTGRLHQALQIDPRDFYPLGIGR